MGLEINYLHWAVDFKNWVNGWVTNSDQGYSFSGNEENLVATLLTETGTFAPHYLLSEHMNHEDDDTWYTFSVYAKPGTRNYLRLKSSNKNIIDLDESFDLENEKLLGDGNGFMNTDLDGWMLCGISAPILSTEMFNLQIMILNDEEEWEYFGEDGTLYIYGAQFAPALTDESSATPKALQITYGYSHYVDEEDEEYELPDPPDGGEDPGDPEPIK